LKKTAKRAGESALCRFNLLKYQKSKLYTYYILCRAEAVTYKHKKFIENK